MSWKTYDVVRKAYAVINYILTLGCHRASDSSVGPTLAQTNGLMVGLREGCKTSELHHLLLVSQSNNCGSFQMLGHRQHNFAGQIMTCFE